MGTQIIRKYCQKNQKSAIKMQKDIKDQKKLKNSHRKIEA